MIKIKIFLVNPTQRELIFEVEKLNTETKEGLLMIYDDCKLCAAVPVNRIALALVE